VIHYFYKHVVHFVHRKSINIDTSFNHIQIESILANRNNVYVLFVLCHRNDIGTNTIFWHGISTVSRDLVASLLLKLIPT
jgi:hypothetical protein